MTRIALHHFRALGALFLASLLPLAAAVQAAPAAPSGAAPAPFKLVVENGGMTQGFDIPNRWDGKFGDVSAKRDTAVFKVGPSSLCVTSLGAKGGQAFQEIRGGAGATIKIAGWIKTDGKVKAQAAVQAFADGYKNNQFFQLLYAQDTTGWAHFEKEITLPPWTAWFNVGLLVEGEGRAWLDEVHEAGSPVDPGKYEAPKDPLVTRAPDRDKPAVPGWGFWPQYPLAWQMVFKDHLRQTKAGGIDVLFYGDSITQGWTDKNGGLPVWDQRYAPLKAANFGIGGDSTRQILWRLGHGEVEGLSPKLVVLKIGTNNLYSDHNAGTDEEVADGITAIVKALRTKLPKTKVLLLGLLPRQNAYFSGRTQHINSLIVKLDDGKSVRFLDMSPKFQESVGVVKKELFVGDQLHLNAKGYEVWGETMAPLLAQMLK